MLHACVQKFDVTDTVGNFLRITLQYTQTKLLHQESTVHVYRTQGTTPQRRITSASFDALLIFRRRLRDSLSSLLLSFICAILSMGASSSKSLKKPDSAQEPAKLFRTTVSRLLKRPAW